MELISYWWKNLWLINNGRVTGGAGHYYILLIEYMLMKFIRQTLVCRICDIWIFKKFCKIWETLNDNWKFGNVTKTQIKRYMHYIFQGQNRIIVLLNDPLSPRDNVSVIVDRCGDAIDISNVKRRNPYALQFSIPERCLEVSMLVGVRITKNGCSLGVRQVKCESRLRELDQILRAHDNPLEFMCQVIWFENLYEN